VRWNLRDVPGPARHALDAGTRDRQRKEVAMTPPVKRERKGAPRVLDWLQNELPSLTRMPWFDQEHLMRCEEYVDDGRIVVRAELPGLDPEKDIEITVAHGTLTINAERREAHRECTYSEFFYGKLGRTLTLPPGIGEDDVTATYRDGILEVRVTPPELVPAGAKVPVQRVE
jgi:HSP20 family protein